MQTINLEEKQLNPDDDLFSEIKTSRDFYTHLKIGDGDADVEEEEIDGDGDEDEEEEEEEEFSFMCGGVITSPIAAEDAFVDGQIKSVFPLFNRDLLFHGEYSGEGLHENLPMRPPVKKVFVETGEGGGRVVASSSSENDEVSASGPYCEWSERKAVEASPEVCKKSNSTGFSKIWRFKDLLGRSNSDGRDAFVFLNNGHAPPSAEEHQAPAAAAVAVKTEEKAAGGEKKAKVNGKVKKGKTAALSAHEVYLRSKAKGEERRRSYLPYRPELMGFFTNVNGGLTKNVHPF